MKKIAIATLLFSMIVSCKDNVEEEDLYLNYAVAGIIIDEYNNEPVSSMNINYILCVEPLENSIRECTYESFGFVESIDNGTFEFFLKYKTLKDKLTYNVSTGVNNIYYAPIYESKKYISTVRELKSIDKLIHKVSKLTKLEVRVKNLNPVDDNDRIEIKKFVFEDPEILPKMNYFGVNNKGIENDKIDYGNNQIGNLLIWRGQNVDSTIDGMIISNRNVYVEYEITKGGITTNLKTKTKLIKRDNYNFFTIEY